MLMLLFLLFFQTAFSQMEFRSEFGKQFKFFCPERQFISHVEIQKKLDRHKVVQDFKFRVLCDAFAEDDNSLEVCRLKQRFALPHGLALEDNDAKACTCDEYLGGIKSFVQNRKRAGIVTKTERFVQLRCCHSFNKIANLTKCSYSGERFLDAPWETVMTTNMTDSPRQALQTIALDSGYIWARVCPYYLESEAKILIEKHLINHCWGSKQRTLQQQSDDIQEIIEKCKFSETDSPFGWGEQSNSYLSENGVIHRNKRLYNKQEHICKDGHMMYAIYKYIKNGPKGKDYVFLTKCHELTYTVCQCKWKMNCTKPEDRDGGDGNSTKYIGGWRSTWNEKLGRREVEVMCCDGDGLDMVSCRLSKNYTDFDHTLTIQRPRYQIDAVGPLSLRHTKVMDGEIIRDIDQWYIENSLIIRFNICRIQGLIQSCKLQCPKTPTTTSTTTEMTTTTENDFVSTTDGASTTTTSETSKIFDFVIVLDDSWSLRDANFQKEKQFMIEFMQLFEVGLTSTRASVVKFSNSSKVMWDFNTYRFQTNDGMTAHLNAIPYEGGRTAISAGLYSSIPILKSSKRSDAGQVVLLITDGRHNQGAPYPTEPAQELRTSGVTIVALGIGSGADLTELESITGDPNLVVLVPFSGLGDAVPRIYEIMQRYA